MKSDSSESRALVRSDGYLRVADRIRQLADNFSIALSPDDTQHIHELFVAMEYVDRIYDALGATERVNFSASVLSFMRSGQTQCSPEMVEKLFELKNITDAAGITSEFCDVVQSIFVASEILRNTEDTRIYIDYTLEEGRLSAELVTMIIREKINQAFANFFHALGATANLMDNFRDAAMDYEKQEMNIRPTMIFYANMLRVILPGLFTAFIQVPHKMRILKMAFNSSLNVFHTYDSPTKLLQKTHTLPTDT